MSRLSNLPVLNFPRPTLVARKGEKYDEILCLVRKKWVALEPEEWVRQHLIYHLSENLGYPMGLMAVEHTLILNDEAKRADLVCFNKDREPVLLERYIRKNRFTISAASKSSIAKRDL